MTSTNAQLEAEIAAARERLGRTIDELAHRANPKTIVDRQVKSFTHQFVDSETGAVRTDTLLKVAAGVAGVVVLFVALRRMSRPRG